MLSNKMTSHQQHGYSILNRIRNTPKTIRRKFGRPSSSSTASSPNSSVPNSPVFRKAKSEDIPDRPIPTDFGSFIKKEKDVVSFKCSYLGEIPLYTANPEHCFNHAHVLAQARLSQSGELTKCRLVISSKSLKIVDEKDEVTRSESGKKKNKNKISKLLDNDKDVVDAKDVAYQAPITVFDSGAICMSRPKPPTLSTKIPLHQIAYSVTIPSNSHVFVLTSKQNVYFSCRVFYFNKAEKAQAATLQLAKHFQRLYQEWNNKRKAKNANRDGNQNILHWPSNSDLSLSSSSGSDSDSERKRMHSSCENVYKRSRQIDDHFIRPRTSSEGQKFKVDRSSLLKLAAMKYARKRSGSDDDTSNTSSNKSPTFLRMEDVRQSKETTSKEKEFKRRQSCYERPDELPLGPGVTIDKLEEKFGNVDLKSDILSSPEDEIFTTYVFKKM